MIRSIRLNVLIFARMSTTFWAKFVKLHQANREPFFSSFSIIFYSVPLLNCCFLAKFSFQYNVLNTFDKLVWLLCQFFFNQCPFSIDDFSRTTHLKFAQNDVHFEGGMNLAGPRFMSKFSLFSLQDVNDPSRFNCLKT